MKAILRQVALGTAVLAVTSMSVGLGITSVAKADPRIITELDATEPFDAMAFHGGVLWVGNSRNMMSSSYRLKAFTADGTLVADQAFPHSQTYIYPYNDRSVLIVGVKSEPNLTHYSIVTYNGPGRALTVQTKAIPAEAWAFQWMGTAGSKEFFIDMSGLVDDPERDANPNLASRTIFTMQSGRPTYSPARVRMPIEGIKVGSDFFVLHRLGLGQPQSGLVRVNSSSFATQNIFTAWRNLVTDVVHVPAVNMIVAAEMGADQILLIDPTTGDLKGTYPVAGGPRTLTAVGHCVAVGAEQTKKIALIDLKGVPDLVDSVDLSSLGAAFHSIRKVAVDRTTGQVFARSNFPCNPMVTSCTQSENSVVAAKLNMSNCFE